MYNVIILFGVSGCGKSLIGYQLSKYLHFEFIEGDDYHSNENIKKMKNNIPLNDDDREAWLDNINKELNKLRNKNVVIACSALKEIYRKRLVKGIVSKIYWFCLKGTFDLIKERLDYRGDHYFKSALLKSQFDIIEYPDYCKFIDVNESPDKIVERIKSEFK